MVAVVALPDENASAYRACSSAAIASSKLSRFGFDDLEYSYKPIGLPTAVCANVVERDNGSITAPVVGSMGEPACIASVPKLYTGDGARGGSEGPDVRGGEDAEGGGAGPMTRLRLSVDSGLDGRWSSSSRLRFAGCGGIAGPIEGIVG